LAAAAVSFISRAAHAKSSSAAGFFFASTADLAGKCYKF
jgi:hypothetical protein